MKLLLRAHPLGSRPIAFALGLLGLGWTAACGSASSNGAAAGPSSDGGSACSTTGPLAGAAYDISKSKFAFGSTPDPEDAGALVRWTGSEGVVAIFTDGSEIASLDGGASAENLAGWSSSTETLTQHVTDYFVSMGVETCQIAGTDLSSSTGGGGSVDGGTTMVVAASQTSVGLVRAVHGVPVVESQAYAQFDVDDQTTVESFYWPEIPADVVSGALAFQAQLAAPGALAAFKAKLPANAQGDGSVVIHHHVAGTPAAFVAVATYQTTQVTPEDDGGDLYFNPSGQQVMDTWSGF